MATTEHLLPCPGAGDPPLAPTRGDLVGICRTCGVRTFLCNGRIQGHEASDVEIAEFA